jgi:phosphonoacetaldehyde hydrolase
MQLPLPLKKDGVRAVFFDISGTTLDFGSRGPVVAFVELFARHGVAISVEEARRPMGTHKRDHIWALLNDPDIAERWEKAHGNRPTEKTLDQLYPEFTPLQKEVLKRHCDVIPGVPEVMHALRKRGIKVANTTGFDTDMMEELVQLAAQGGYEPDIWVCPDQVGGGRPAPWMAFHAARALNVFPMHTIVKVGDTAADVAEADAAGMWAVSVVRHGNEVGLSEDELANLSAAERNARIDAARARLAAHGPHYLIDGVADLLPVIDTISARLARGERP